jgi:hypothetical protein
MINIYSFYFQNICQKVYCVLKGIKTLSISGLENTLQRNTYNNKTCHFNNDYEDERLEFLELGTAQTQLINQLFT